jgi:hypothetical protein
MIIIGEKKDRVTGHVTKLFQIQHRIRREEDHELWVDMDLDGCGRGLF